MNLDITSLFPDLEALEALTPEGRWEMLQRWLKENPEYGERVEEWSIQSVDQVFNEICILAVRRYGALASMFLKSPAIKPKAIRTIEILQACYRERAGNQTTEKEIKNGTQRRSTRVPRKSGKHPKRTDQA